MSTLPSSRPRRRIVPHSPWRPGKTRNGKIARLPQALRESVNLMLLDGLTYEAIIAQLGADGHHLNYHNLKRWRQGGYQDWLSARERRHHAQLREQLAQKIIAQSDPNDVSSKLKIALATQHFHALIDFDPLALEGHLAADPTVYISLLNVIARSAK